MRKSHTPKAARTPPLNAVRVFEAAERHRSFTRAAQELGVTQGAVSRAVSTLEEHFGFPVFERTGSGLVPSEGAEAFARSVRKALHDVRDAATILAARRTRSRVLTLQAYSGFASRWLVPRLPEFHAAYPEIDLRLASTHDGPSLSSDGADARIRYGHGRWRGVASDLLFLDELCPVCSPALLAPRDGPYAPEALNTLPLIHLRGFPHDWDEWLAAAGAPGITGSRTILFEELSVAYQAAESGAGVVLGQRKHLIRERASGALHEPCATVLRRELGYYLTYRPGLAADAAFGAFRRWLLECMDRAEG
ncbi:LysR family transcriptional regulator [Pseudoroseomonas wenyumeiae]|uniref:LysR family transcriptional regulator n=1 Tax=Teichococcus wenyumeiae TaxID=2478470 RepID=A0ABX9VEU8_9PROT|nr:LysR substrate-binding domain-containing protein [Pseudoroseomonas wenyumeiae]RMI17276.1 LysR family transcriptional regulator [Pseudoroseomonas wenyumeiae]